MRFDEVFDSFRKATETTLQAQQDLFRQWMSQWPAFPFAPGPAPGSAPGPASAPAGPGAGDAERVLAFQKEWADSVSALMTRHCEALDAQYRAGIRAIEETLRTAEARSPEEFRGMTEELWRKSLEVLRGTIENQIRDFQAAVETRSDLVARKASAG
ncbi:hypothetical protein OJF2_03010 [Aquisphaera giovannonii]|uniref:Phasin protein n=1 Tax=Aquisphaera giovannonii TaxID=406548 RepID=A0A5B9VTJ8_9BACT|nr:hypothetical protein [Aquisphaera giovannonii]QEH31836.1 hypothetical protein OJF2_03010 [Aquisphaera giovannonii]